MFVGHVGVNVTDLDRSIAFYQRVFGLGLPQAPDPADPHRYARLTWDGELVLTLWPQSEGSFRSDTPALHHLAFRGRERETSTPGSGRLGGVTQRELIGDADTFFLTTYAQGHGADMSHRGGNPGFVTVVDDTHLSWPEYAGNRMYMSLGNLLSEPRCAIVFPDWPAGRTLHLRGRAFADWDARRAASVRKAQCMVDFETEEVVEIADGMPLRWRFGEYHRFNPPVGKPAPAGQSTPVASAR